MKCLTQAQGDGTWGQLHDAYFLAEGDSQELTALFAKLQKQYGKPEFGQEGKPLDPISDKPIPAKVFENSRLCPWRVKFRTTNATSEVLRPNPSKLRRT